jgi:hypothetical protein
MKKGWKKRTLVWLGAVVFCLLCMLGFVLSRTKESYDSANVKMVWVRWKAPGRPLVVEGSVVDMKGDAVSGLTIDLMTDSGANAVTTDSGGHFLCNVGETELRGITLRGIETIEWPSLGLSVRYGLIMGVQLKVARRSLGLPDEDVKRN